MTSVHAQTLWNEDTMLTSLEQLYFVATAAAHLYSPTLVWFCIFQWGDRKRIAGKSPSDGVPSCRAQIEPLHSTSNTAVQSNQHSRQVPRVLIRE